MSFASKKLEDFINENFGRKKPKEPEPVKPIEVIPNPIEVNPPMEPLPEPIKSPEPVKPIEVIPNPIEVNPQKEPEPEPEPVKPLEVIPNPIEVNPPTPRNQTFALKVTQSEKDYLERWFTSKQGLGKPRGMVLCEFLNK